MYWLYKLDGKSYIINIYIDIAQKGFQRDWSPLES